MRDNRDKLDQLANKLIEKEVIFKEDLETIFGKRPFDKDIAEEVAEKERTASNGNGISEPAPIENNQTTDEVKP